MGIINSHRHSISNIGSDHLSSLNKVELYKILVFYHFYQSLNLEFLIPLLLNHSQISYNQFKLLFSKKSYTIGSSKWLYTCGYIPKNANNNLIQQNTFRHIILKFITYQVLMRIITYCTFRFCIYIPVKQHNPKAIGQMCLILLIFP